MVKKPLTKKELEAELARFKDLAARAQADLQNVKARAEKEAEVSRKFATAAVLLNILPTIDNFQRAAQHVPEDLKDHEWAKGIVAIEEGLIRELSAAGLRRIDALGNLVDPEKHDVLMQGPGEEGRVIEVVEEGYMLHDKILRPAKVKVGSGSPVSS